MYNICVLERLNIGDISVSFKGICMLCLLHGKVIVRVLDSIDIDDDRGVSFQCGLLGISVLEEVSRIAWVRYSLGRRVILTLPVPCIYIYSRV